MFQFVHFPKEQRLQELAAEYPQLDKSAIQAYLTLMKVAADLETALIAHFARFGLSQGRFYVLMFLRQCSSGAMNPSKLAELTGVKNATITGLIDGLEKDGLVKREVDPKDRRASRVKMTAKGKKLLERMLPEHFSRIAGLMEHLEKPERSRFVESLLKVREGLNAFSPQNP